MDGPRLRLRADRWMAPGWLWGQCFVGCVADDGPSWRRSTVEPRGREMQKSRSTCSVERLFHVKSRGECASFEPVAGFVADYVAAAIECRDTDLHLLRHEAGCVGA